MHKTKIKLENMKILSKLNLRTSGFNSFLHVTVALSKSYFIWISTAILQGLHLIGKQRNKSIKQQRN